MVFDAVRVLIWYVFAVKIAVVFAKISKSVELMKSKPMIGP